MTSNAPYTEAQMDEFFATVPAENIATRVWAANSDLAKYDSHQAGQWLTAFERFIDRVRPLPEEASDDE